MMDLLKSIEEKQNKRCHIYPRHSGTMDVAFDFESEQKSYGYSDETNYDVKILPSGIPKVTIVDRDIEFRYNRIEISGLSRERIGELFANKGEALRSLYTDLGIHDFMNFAYVDDNGVLYLVFNFCDFNGKVLTAPSLYRFINGLYERL